MLPVDVLVVGGGLQGLLVLDSVVAAGRSCILLTPSDLGAGQTLHSHGVLNTGFGFAGPDLREVRDRLVLPSLRAHGVETYGDWYLLSGEEVPFGREVSADSLPAGFEVGMARVHQLPEFNFSSPQLVAALAGGHRQRILRGRLASWRGSGSIEEAVAELDGVLEPVVFAPGLVVAAAGTGTKRFLKGFPGAGEQFERIRHRRVHILCVRGPATSLPAVSVLSLQHGLNLVAHESEGMVSWYSTPFQDADPHFEDVPDDAEAVPEPSVVQDGFRRLETLYPPLATAAGLRFTAYAGYRQDVGEVVGTPLCERVVGVNNLLVALPSLVVNAWKNAAVIAELVGSRPGSVPQPVLDVRAPDVGVGRHQEDRPGVSWSSWGELHQLGADAPLAPRRSAP